MTTSSPSTKKRIGELLVCEGLVDEGQVHEALAMQKEKGGKTVKILISLGYLDIDEFTRFLSSQSGIASIDLSQYEVPIEMLELIPRDFAEEHEVFPIDKMGKLMTVGMAFPLDSKTMEELETITGLIVKALLCGRDDIINAIQQYYVKSEEDEREREERKKPDLRALGRFATATKLENISALIQNIDVLPALPQTVHKVQEAAEDPNVPLDEVADMLALDPPVSAKMLRLVNAAEFGVSTRVNDIRMAVKLLGLRETAIAVLSCSVIDMLEKSKHFDYDTFWKEAVFAGSAAKAIAAKCKVASRSAIFCAGLLHDIGRFAFSEVASGRYDKVDKNLYGEALIQAEQAEFGIAHPEAGHLLAKHWNLPEEIADAIRLHHAPDLATNLQEDVVVVALAAHMGEAYAREIKVDDTFWAQSEAALNYLGMDGETAMGIYSDAAESVAANVM